MANYLITGANRGLGLEFVRQLLARGDSVVACCREPDQGAELQALGQAAGDRCGVVALDVTDADAIEELPGHLDGAPLDVLINNAGVAAGEEAFGEFDPETMERVLKINSIAPMLVTQAVAPLMKGTSPKIVCITSGLGSISQATDLSFGLSYGMSKAALNMGVKKLSAEMKGRGIVIWRCIQAGCKRTWAVRAPRSSRWHSISGMLKVIDGLTDADNAKFLDYAGKELPW